MQSNISVNSDVNPWQTYAAPQSLSTGQVTQKHVRIYPWVIGENGERSPLILTRPFVDENAEEWEKVLQERMADLKIMDDDAGTY